jgi:hypothetical protein
MKKIISFLLFFVLLVGCKSLVKGNNSGNFKMDNYSAKTIEFIWITPEGNFYPVAKSINISNGQSFELDGLEPGVYDIAIDFKNEYNSYNSKKDKRLCLIIDKGETTYWSVDSSGNILR